MDGSSDILIRDAGADDAVAIAKILHESFAEYESLYTREGFTATTPNAGQVTERMREGPIWVALHQGEAVGTVAAVRKERSVYMRGMAVLPTARGLRVGSRLLEHVESWSCNEECARLFLSTTPFLSSAIRLYERQGFRRVKEQPQHLFGTPLFTMEKEIRRKI